MNIGVVFPQTEIGSDVGVLREFFRGVSGVGYTHVLIYDHVFGVDASRLPEWDHPYAVEDEFHEPFTLLAFAAAMSPLELVTGVLVLPQRQTVLVAKQSAQLDVLTGGRFRLGVGIGWNQAEYLSLGETFDDRASRYEEQLSLLRRLWTEESLDFNGLYHQVPGGGIRPMPIQRPIPLWLGGGRTGNPAVLSRIGRMADGWFPNMFPRASGEYELKDLLPAITSRLEEVRRAAERAGRDPDGIGLQGTIELGPRASRGRLQRDLAIWASLGATHVALRTLHHGYRGRQHLERLLEAVTDMPIGT